MSAPAGFREALSGLIVPEEVSREREIWTKDEWKFHERVVRFYRAKGMKVFLQCQHEACQKAPLTRQRQPSGDITLTCEHKQRLLTRAY